MNRLDAQILYSQLEETKRALANEATTDDELKQVSQKLGELMGRVVVMVDSSKMFLLILLVPVLGPPSIALSLLATLFPLRSVRRWCRAQSGKLVLWLVSYMLRSVGIEL